MLDGTSAPLVVSRLAHEDVIDLARRWFLDGRRIDMQQLARELGIGRATIYPWCG